MAGPTGREALFRSATTLGYILKGIVGQGLRFPPPPRRPLFQSSRISQSDMTGTFHPRVHIRPKLNYAFRRMETSVRRLVNTSKHPLVGSLYDGHASSLLLPSCPNASSEVPFTPYPLTILSPLRGSRMPERGEKRREIDGESRYAC